MSHTYRVFLEREPTYSELVEIWQNFRLMASTRQKKQDTKESFLTSAENQEVALTFLGPRKIVSQIYSGVDLTRTPWEISITSSYSQQSLDTACDLARHLQQLFGGHIDDGRVDFGKSANEKRSNNSLHSESDLKVQRYQILWITTPENFSASDVCQFLRVIAEYIPNTLPCLYGTSHPFQYIFTGDSNDEESVVTVAKKALMFVWSPKDTRMRGYLSFWKAPKVQDQENNSFCINLDIETIDPSWNDIQSIKRAFIAVARKYNCFFGGVKMNRATALSKSPSFLGSEEQWRIKDSTHWSGIPNNKAWLTWFDGPILSAIAQYIDSSRLSEGGNLLELSDKPLSEEELESVYPSIPEFLLDQEGNNDHIRATENYLRRKANEAKKQ